MPAAPKETRVTPVPVASPAAVLAHGDAVVVDLRSPTEFANDHLPGAVSVPLFDDHERAVVGTLYKRVSPERAFAAGRDVVAGKIEELVAHIADAAGLELPRSDLRPRVEALCAEGIAGLERGLEAVPAGKLPERPIVLHCWRGGLRSRSVLALLRGLGLEACVGLEGGYKAYRKMVLAGLEEFAPPATPGAFVLRGLTGVGKTLVLRELERQRPGWTFDLEDAARHRSSLLGMVGLEPVSQKHFETRLFARVQRGFAGPVVYEGESRKVGDAIIPARIWEHLRGGANVLLEAPVEVRVRVLMDDYLARPENRAPLREQLIRIEELATGRLALAELLDAGREEELVEVLLERYYDPLYRHSEKGRSYALRVDSSDPAVCAAEIAAWVEERGDQ